MKDSFIIINQNPLLIKVGREKINRVKSLKYLEERMWQNGSEKKEIKEWRVGEKSGTSLSPEEDHLQQECVI